MIRSSCVLLMGLAATSCVSADLEDEVVDGLRLAVGYFSTEIATEGGYLWEYAADLSERWGEGEATETQIWVQPPGTPAVGQALLRAYLATEDESILRAAEAAGDALIQGQLQCGGWDYKIEFDEEQRARWRYRQDGIAGRDAPEGRNTGTFDDNNTQSAVRYLMALHAATGEERFGEAARYALDFMLRAQFENGAWPQRFPLPEKGYSGFYTFNDNAMNDCIDVMVRAYRQYGDAKYQEPAERGGAFIILSQLDAPQAGWAQQYDADLKPVWARKFEPESVCSAVTSRNIRTLVQLHLEFGDDKYLEPIGDAIEWLQESQISDGRWARFYELESNRPLYFTTEYELVYTDEDLPTHYSFQGEYGVRSAIRQYEDVTDAGRDAYIARLDRAPTADQRVRRAASAAERASEVLGAMDADGRWLDGDRIKCATFAGNVNALSAYLEAVGPGQLGGA
jgi:PelA/Pel-15E family pectate lyase